MAAIDEGLRAQIGNAYTSGDYTTANNLLTQNNISQNDLMSSFNLSSDAVNTAIGAGRLSAYAPPTTDTSSPDITRFSDPGTVQNQANSSAPPNLRDTIGTMFQNKDYAGMNNTINQYGLTADWAKQNYGLSDGDLSNGKSLGINFQPGTNTAGAATTPAQQPGDSGTPAWLTQMNDPNWQRDQLTQGNGALGYRDPSTGNLILPHYSGSSDSGMPTADGYRVLDGGKQTGTGMQTYRVLDANGKDTGKTEQMGYVSDWFTNIMPYVIGAAATFGIGSTIAGVAGAAGTGAGSSVMDAAAASDAGGGSLGGAAPGLANPTAATGLEGVTSGGTSAATTGSQGLNPAFDTLGNPADAGITGSPFTPATTQAPLPTGPGGFTAATSNLGNTLGPTPGFTPGSPFNPSLPLSVTGGTPNGTVPGISPSTAATTAGGLNGVTSGGITPSTAANGLGSLISGLTGIATAVQSGNAQKDAANNMLDWLKSQQAKIDNLYQPGSPEYNLLMQQMAAKDAAAGRNSQYGVRSVDLAAKIAQIKAQYTAQLTAGIAGNMSTAFNQSANSNAGLDAILGNLTKPNAQGQSTLSNIVGQFF